MTDLQAIEEANDTAQIRTFRFADIREAQAFFDSFNVEDFPCHVMVPYDWQEAYQSGIVGGISKTVIPLKGWLVTRIPEDTNDYYTIDVQKKYIYPMRFLVRKFLKALLESTLTDPEVSSIQTVIKPEYMFLNQHTFGVSYTMNWPIIQSVC